MLGILNYLLKLFSDVCLKVCQIVSTADHLCIDISWLCFLLQTMLFLVLGIIRDFWLHFQNYTRTPLILFKYFISVGSLCLALAYRLWTIFLSCILMRNWVFWSLAILIWSAVFLWLFELQLNSCWSHCRVRRCIYGLLSGRCWIHDTKSASPGLFPSHPVEGVSFLSLLVLQGRITRYPLSRSFVQNEQTFVSFIFPICVSSSRSYPFLVSSLRYIRYKKEIQEISCGLYSLVNKIPC